MNITRRAAVAIMGAGLMAAAASLPAVAQTVESIKSAVRAAVRKSATVAAG